MPWGRAQRRERSDSLSTISVCRCSGGEHNDPRLRTVARLIRMEGRKSAELMLGIEMLCPHRSSCSGQALFAHAAHEAAGSPGPRLRSERLKGVR